MTYPNKKIFFDGHVILGSNNHNRRKLRWLEGDVAADGGIGTSRTCIAKYGIHVLSHRLRRAVKYCLLAMCVDRAMMSGQAGGYVPSRIGLTSGAWRP